MCMFVRKMMLRYRSFWLTRALIYCRKANYLTSLHITDFFIYRNKIIIYL
jgi:hypothetical protein